ncbi:MAG TPA: 50S ribosomal protein L22 [archaeon]|nr:50S ribosomal protein L22 [archaeon]
MEKTATAKAMNLNISPKFSVEVATNIRGMQVDKALRFLEDVVAQRRPVILRRHNKEVGHHHGRPGRYPLKVANAFMELINNAQANADYLGLESPLVILSVEAHRGIHKKPWGGKAIGKARKRARRTNLIITLARSQGDAKKKKSEKTEKVVKPAEPEKAKPKDVKSEKPKPKVKDK